VLLERLQKAIDDENYEDAAILRDKLKEIDQGAS
jgi:protein-arginine kinase activator protein McsA